MGVFKAFLSRALHICSENYLTQEIEFLVNVFAEKSPKIYEQHTSKKENVNIETIKNDKVVKPPWVPKLGLKLRQEF